MELLVSSQNIESIGRKMWEMSESFSNLCVEKRWDFLWYNNDNNLKPVDL